MGAHRASGVVQGLAAVAPPRADPDALHQVQRAAHHLRVRHQGQGRAGQGALYTYIDLPYCSIGL